MRIAVISDIHGNDVAFEAALTDIQQQSIDHIVCLGDAIQGGAQPAEVVRRLRETKCPTVMGNSDAWLLTGKETGNEKIAPERMQKLQVVREWSLTKLSQEDREFINAFPLTITLPIDEKRNLLCFHGSPTSFDDFVLPSTLEEDFQRLLKPFAANILTGGHMHLQYTRRIIDSPNFFFNPGSVGVAYNHEQSNGFRLDPWAEYAILTVEGGQLSLEFRRVPVDTEKLFTVLKESGRPYADETIAQYSA